MKRTNSKTSKGAKAQAPQLGDKLRALVVGSEDFIRRASYALREPASQCEVLTGTYREAWPLLLSNKPELLIIEIGISHNDSLHAEIAKLLTDARSRFGTEIALTLALTSPSYLTAGGDFLFQDQQSLAPSGLVDAYIVAPPGSLPSIPSLELQLIDLIHRYAEEFARRIAGERPLPSLLAKEWAQSMADPKSRELWMRWLPRYAKYTSENPIIVGETGTGKTRLALAIHRQSELTGAFIGITPRDFSSTELVQAELFGSVAGAYTGAVDKWGLVRKAERGTLFFDELQSIDRELQGKLITFIEDKSYRRVGSSEAVQAEVRFVFASNRPLAQMIATGVLRDDFAYRLERVLIELPPLRERRLDITAALAYALAKISRERPYKTKIAGFEPDAYRVLFSHAWPGNLRQLENSVAKLCEIADMSQSSLINLSMIDQVFNGGLNGAPATGPEILALAAQRVSHLALSEPITSLSSGVSHFSDQVRRAALEATGGDRTKAAELIDESEKALELMVARSNSANGRG